MQKSYQFPLLSGFALVSILPSHMHVHNTMQDVHKTTLASKTASGFATDIGITTTSLHTNKVSNGLQRLRLGHLSK